MHNSVPIIAKKRCGKGIGNNNDLTIFFLGGWLFTCSWQAVIQKFKVCVPVTEAHSTEKLKSIRFDE